MQTITININGNELLKKVVWMLEHFQDDGLEIVSEEDIEDLSLLRTTRNEESISFDDYMKNEN